MGSCLMASWFSRWLALFVVVSTTMAAPQVPCFLIFGDSLIDNGNNNNEVTTARADYYPYGVDYNHGTSGRFSNGKTIVDFIAESLGFNEIILPYKSARGRDLLRGVNFASGGGGIRPETGQQLGYRIDFNGQVNNYNNYVGQIINIFGDENAAADHLNQCIFFIGLGSNDYLNNYFMPLFYPTGSQYTPEQYADDLIQRYTRYVKSLYNNGGRKFAIMGIGEIGCSPSELAQNSPDGRTCVERINSANQIFNNKLRSTVDRYNDETDDAQFIYIDSYSIFQDLHSNPSTHGFRVTNVGCCGVGRNNGQITCLPEQIPCSNRNEYMFWDAYHPTEAVHRIIGRRSYRAEKGSDCHPFDIRRLAELR